jgi:hypothetical protein
MTGPWQALIGEGRVGGRELRIAVGGQVDRGEALVVQREWERQRNSSDRIIPVIAYINGAGHDRTGDRCYADLAR